jgi:hypothetical protein
VEKRSTRKWIDAAKTEKEAVRAFGFDVLTPQELKSPAQLEKVEGVTSEWLEKRCTAVSSGVTLAPETDKRQSVNQLELDFGKGEDMPTGVYKRKKTAKKTATKKKPVKKSKK